MIDPTDLDDDENISAHLKKIGMKPEVESKILAMKEFILKGVRSQASDGPLQR